MVQPTKFAISAETKSERRVLLLAGELDLSSVAELSERVNSELDGSIDGLTLDLGQLTFMDSTGLRLLIELDQRASREEWKLTLIPSEHESTNTILRLTGADAELPFESSFGLTIMVDETARRAKGSPAIRIGLPSDPQAPAAARAAVSGFLEGREPDAGGLASLRLLVSELVSNAVLHSDAPAGSEITLSMSLLDAGVVRVEVVDRGSGFTPRPRDPNRHDGGYGLSLVEKQANRWGIDRREGACVWFEMGIGEGSR